MQLHCIRIKIPSSGLTLRPALFHPRSSVVSNKPHLPITGRNSSQDAISNAAAKLHSMKREEESARAFDRALETARAIESMASRANALAYAAERLSEAKQHAEARRVLAEAERVAEKIPERDLRQHALRTIRDLADELP